MPLHPRQLVRGNCTISRGSRCLLAYPSPLWPARPPPRGAGTTAGFLLGRIERGDDRQFASPRRRDQRSVPPPRQKWFAAAHLDRNRTRMAELFVASRPVCVTNPPSACLGAGRIKRPID